MQRVSRNLMKARQYRVSVKRERSVRRAGEELAKHVLSQGPSMGSVAGEEGVREMRTVFWLVLGQPRKQVQ